MSIDEFEEQASGERQGVVSEFWGFMMEQKKYWLLPVLIVFLLLGILIVVGGTAAGPFIYTLF